MCDICISVSSDLQALSIHILPLRRQSQQPGLAPPHSQLNFLKSVASWPSRLPCYILAQRAFLCIFLLPPTMSFPSSPASDIAGLLYHQLYVDSAILTNVLNEVEIVSNPSNGRCRSILVLLMFTLDMLRLNSYGRKNGRIYANVDIPELEDFGQQPSSTSSYSSIVSTGCA